MLVRPDVTGLLPLCQQFYHPDQLEVQHGSDSHAVSEGEKVVGLRCQPSESFMLRVQGVLGQFEMPLGAQDPLRIEVLKLEILSMTYRICTIKVGTCNSSLQSRKGCRSFYTCTSVGIAQGSRSRLVLLI